MNPYSKDRKLLLHFLKEFDTNLNHKKKLIHSMLIENQQQHSSGQYLINPKKDRRLFGTSSVETLFKGITFFSRLFPSVACLLSTIFCNFCYFSCFSSFFKVSACLDCRSFMVSITEVSVLYTLSIFRLTEFSIPFSFSYTEA